MFRLEIRSFLNVAKIALFCLRLSVTCGWVRDNFAVWSKSSLIIADSSWWHFLFRIKIKNVDKFPLERENIAISLFIGQVAWTSLLSDSQSPGIRP